MSPSKFPTDALNYLVHRRVSYFLKTVLALGIGLLLLQARYQAAMEVGIILSITFLPVFLGQRFKVMSSSLSR
jgi:hypothetical protein